MSDTTTDDLRIKAISPLISPSVLSYYLPISESAAKTVVSAREQAEKILTGEDDRLLVVVGRLLARTAPYTLMRRGAKFPYIICATLWRAGLSLILEMETPPVFASNAGQILANVARGNDIMA